jgi:beta-lactamase regulating signal transducer with metallopeptidase domain
MNIETLNEWGGRFLDFAWPMLWQSSLLIVLVFSLDLLLARKIRAAVRYALWLTILVKLLLPPTLALPSSVAWWLLQAKTTAIEIPQAKVTVTYGAPAPSSEPEFVFHDLPPMPKPRLDDAGYALFASVAVSAGLLLLLLVRCRQMNGNVRKAAEGGHFADAFEAARQISGLRSRIKLKMVDDHTSPAVYGLFAPVILLPRILTEKLSPQQLRTVLLHELIHLRRADDRAASEN